jgi:hypothetical protein
MTRQLATIQVISDLQPIPGADRIEVASVLGWKVVVAKKDELKAGDLIVYFEIDSILPERPEFEFMRERKFKVKTIKLRAQVSQGLVMPLFIAQDLTNKQLYVGDDVSDLLGVRKYDPQGDLEARLASEQAARSNNKIEKFLLRNKWYRRLFARKKDKGWPKFINKSDEERIQKMPQVLVDQKDTYFSCTEKLDGQSATYFLAKNHQRFLWWGKPYIFGVCSRNLRRGKPDNSSYWQIARTIHAEFALKYLIGNNTFVAIQGEIVGPGIQGNKYERTGLDFYAYNLIYPDGKINSLDASGILIDCGIKFVPILCLNIHLPESVDDIVKLSDGRSILADITREGIVCRCYEKNISFKVVNPTFLLKYGE